MVWYISDVTVYSMKACVCAVLYGVNLYTLSASVYANVDVKVQKSTTVSKTMFATHVNEMNCNGGEGFEA